jgi:hypothetical protein
VPTLHVGVQYTCAGFPTLVWISRVFALAGQGSDWVKVYSGGWMLGGGGEGGGHTPGTLTFPSLSTTRDSTPSLPLADSTPSLPLSD